MNRSISEAFNICTYKEGDCPQKQSVKYSNCEDCLCSEYRTALKRISKLTRCDGPECMGCITGEHPPTTGASIAIEILNEKKEKKQHEELRRRNNVY